MITPASTTTSFKHASYRNGQWIQHAAIPGTKMWVDQSPSGTIFALAQSYSCSSCVAPLAIHRVATDGTKTTEQLWTVRNDTDVGFTVGNDAFPAVVYSSGQLRHARRGATGWRTFIVNQQTISADSVATSGGENATVFATSGGVRTYRQTGTTFSEL